MQDIRNLSFTAIFEFAKSPNALYHYWENPPPSTPSIEMGHVFEKLFASPWTFFDKYAVFSKSEIPFPDKDMRNTENKLFYNNFIAQNAEKEIISEEVFETAQKMCQTASEYSPMLRGNYETSVKFDNFVLFGIPFKGELDILFPELELIQDLKVVPSADPEKLKYVVLNEKKLHWQAYIYKKAMKMKHFAFLAIEMKKSFEFFEFQMTEYHYQLAEHELKIECERYLRWHEMGYPRVSYNFRYDTRTPLLPFAGYIPYEGGDYE